MLGNREQPPWPAVAEGAGGGAERKQQSEGENRSEEGLGTEAPQTVSGGEVTGDAGTGQVADGTSSVLL